MIYHSVKEIFDSIDESHARLRRSVEGLGRGQESFRPAPGTWSIADVVEHLATTEQQTVRLAGMLLGKGEAAGAAHADQGARPFEPVSIDEFVERSRTEKYQSPEMVRPGGGVDVSESLARLGAAREALREMLPRFERVDGASLRYPHPAFGLINLYQWLAFVGAHEQRHLAQIEALKETMSAKS